MPNDTIAARARSPAHTRSPLRRLLAEHAQAPPPVIKNTAELFSDLIQQLGDEGSRAKVGG